jgi:Type II secretion system (T2SS), protein M
VLEPRERRTITIAGAVLAVAVLFAYGILPFARRWSAREDLIATRAAQVSRLRWLAEHEVTLRQTASERLSRAISVGRPQLLAGRSPALAASSLQTIVQGYADEAGITVRELNVAGAPDSSSAGGETIPATVSAVGDIYGVSDFVSKLQNGTTLIDIREIGVSPNSALRGELLQLSLVLRAPYGGARGTD